LNQRIVESYNSVVYYFPLGIFIVFFFFFQICSIFKNDFNIINIYFFTDYFSEWENYEFNINILSQVLYNYYAHLVYLAAWVLLLALIGSIAITLPINNIFCQRILNKESVKLKSKLKLLKW